jgi:hypothetical protein
MAQAQMVMSAHTLIEEQLQHGSSGTSAVPDTTPIPMLMGSRDGWLLMLHTNIFVANTQQQAQGERGRDAFFSTSWIMPMAQRQFGEHGGELTLRTMVSLEPATVGGRNYPDNTRTTSSWSSQLSTTCPSATTHCCRCMRRRWAIRPSVQARTRTGNRPAKTPSPLSAITRRTPRTSPSTS